MATTVFIMVFVAIILLSLLEWSSDSKCIF